MDLGEIGGIHLVFVMNSGEECTIRGAFSVSVIIGILPPILLVFLEEGSLYDVDEDAEDDEDAEEEDDNDEYDGLR